MDPHLIEAAYGPFVTELLAGDFSPPEQGWPADLVAAHVAWNNDLIAAAAELIAAGRDASYDNATAVDDAQLQDYARRAGGLEGLASAVKTSAGGLSAAMKALDATSATSTLVVRIADSGAVVRNAPMAIGALIEGNATFHLDNHLDQLRALRQ